MNIKKRIILFLVFCFQVGHVFGASSSNCCELCPEADNPVMYDYISKFDKTDISHILRNNRQKDFPLPHLNNFVQAAAFGLKDDIDYFIKQDTSFLKEHGVKALYVAVEMGNVPIIELLLDAGVPVNGRTESGLTPIYPAFHFGRCEIALLLIERGASTEIRVDGIMSSEQVVEFGGRECMRGLL